MKYIVNTMKYLTSFTVLMIFAAQALEIDASSGESQSIPVENKPCKSSQDRAGDNLFRLFQQLRNTDGSQIIRDIRYRQYIAAQAQRSSFPERVCARSLQSNKPKKSYQRDTVSTRAKAKNPKR